MTTAAAPPRRSRDREATADRLIASSIERSHDPATEIDWSAEPVDGLYYSPPELVSLYGTDLWDDLTGEQQIELSKHEVASIASSGIWFESILMELLLKHAYDQDPTSSHVRYAWTEIGDECRHSDMFARMIGWFDAPYYGPSRPSNRLGRLFIAITDEAVAFAGTLFVEAILDVMQRQAMTDERVQPLVRHVSRIHVVEEARHMSYAREELARQWRGTGRLRRPLDRWLLSLVCTISSLELVHPRVYAAVGLDPREARAAAESNPYWRQVRRDTASSVLSLFDDLGMIDRPSRLVMRRIGLLAA